jgi:hypothetical protein
VCGDEVLQKFVLAVDHNHVRRHRLVRHAELATIITLSPDLK